MIFDSIQNANLYKAISPNLSAALEFMQENDLNAMETGRYPVAGGKVLVIIKKGYSTKSPEEAKWESHRKDIDIQYLLSGEENIGYCRASVMEPRTEYDEQSDKILYHPCKNGFVTNLKPGDFLILFPDDAHATCLDPETRTVCNKAVIKVRIED